MMQTFLIDCLDTVTLTCPSCGGKKVLQVSTMDLSKFETRVRARCNCGHAYQIVLKKKDLRENKLKLPGTFATTGPVKRYGRITVKRLNSLGVIFTVANTQEPSAGQKLLLEFVLDDVKQSIVRKEAIVIASRQGFVSARFSCPDHYDNLGPYLFFNRLDTAEAVSP